MALGVVLGSCSCCCGKTIGRWNPDGDPDPIDRADPDYTGRHTLARRWITSRPATKRATVGFGPGDYNYDYAFAVDETNEKFWTWGNPANQTAADGVVRQYSYAVRSDQNPTLDWKAGTLSGLGYPLHVNQPGFASRPSGATLLGLPDRFFAIGTDYMWVLGSMGLVCFRRSDGEIQRTIPYNDGAMGWNFSADSSLLLEIAIGPDDSVIVCRRSHYSTTLPNTNDRVIRISLAGTIVANFAPPAGSRIAGMRVVDGNILVVGDIPASGARIWRIDSTALGILQTLTTSPAGASPFYFEIIGAERLGSRIVTWEISNSPTAEAIVVRESADLSVVGSRTVGTAIAGLPGWRNRQMQHRIGDDCIVFAGPGYPLFDCWNIDATLSTRWSLTVHSPPTLTWPQRIEALTVRGTHCIVQSVQPKAFPDTHYGERTLVGVDLDDGSEVYDFPAPGLSPVWFEGGNSPNIVAMGFDAQDQFWACGIKSTSGI